MAHSKLHVLSGLLLLVVLSASATPTPDAVNKPIVVQTQLQNYDQPTLRDYEECQENRDKCLDGCAEDIKCEGECPVCPELFSKPVMVQGVNDTDLRAEPLTPVNTTNIIKLTNEIRNIIKHEIQQRNEVNVQVQQNVSQVGGRFGLGYSDLGSCCYVVLMDRKCEKNSGENCREKSRQRVCGERCQARVMLAKRVVQCDAEDPLKCRETIEYVPRRRRIHTKTSLPSEPCRYFGNSWPYFSCGQNQNQGQGMGMGMIPSQRPKRSTCQECLNLPYGYILQSGLPPQCGGCFQGFGSPYMYNPYGFNPFVPFPSYEVPNNIPNNDLSNTGNDIDDKNVAGSGDFILCEDDDVEKCLKENGKQGAPSNQEQAPGLIDEDYLEDPEYGVETQRRRRRHNNRVFIRSNYSKRNRKNE
ncbi:LOW QUALITY PROTEIN: uncharacterized protein Dana_GF17832 [Drosophila ananassae]|uniref:Uncharacterized protein n=1 Tax=Drosophila ananassae TaxID=7217 RepID=B3M1A7_DROAN|nr:LOW QUALITY PROTEIN: uncharacterized protein Dana_GF17832 [Drosophila ananassae]